MSAPWLDGCPGCVVNTELPKATLTLAGAVRCAYQCGDCGHSWTTDWSTESVDAVSDFPLISWEDRGGPSGVVDATRPGPDHLPFANNERG